jgi:hypothetical protein
MNTNPALSQLQRQRKAPYLLLAAGCALLALAFGIGISDNPPDIVSMLAGFFAVALGIAYGFGGSAHRNPARQLLYWAPRALCIAFAVFTSLFALDVFNEGLGFWGTSLALLMHLVPTFVLLVALALAWRREWVGGIVFTGLAVFYVAWGWNKPFARWSTFLLIAGPLALTGALFLLNWYDRRSPRG